MNALSSENHSQSDFQLQARGFDFLREFRHFALLIESVTPRDKASKLASVGKEIRLTERKTSSDRNGLVSLFF
jgi:hypothetical protein